MKVLSLFDGISCGMVALDRLGIKPEIYDAYEIEENAIKISEHNYPQINHKGDVFKAIYTEGEYDLLIGGSPCLKFAICQKSSCRETSFATDEKDKGIGQLLFEQYERALKTIKPKYFLYENNYSMSDGIRDGITERLGVKPIMINSALVSAQNRKRYYWTNIPNVFQPDDKGILLKDIIEHGNVDRDKSLCLARRYAGFCGSQSYLCRRYFGKSFGQAVFEGDIQEIKNKWKENPRFEDNGEINIRQLTPKECERLQTLPDDYTNVEDVSKQMRIECIGNGWTVDVIKYILSNIPN